MPLCTLHLFALSPSTHPSFLKALKANVSPLVVARVIRWIILPTTFSTSHLLARNIHWDYLIILPSTSPLSPDVLEKVQHHWYITAGVPSRLVQNFAEKNERLLRLGPDGVPRSIGSLESKETTRSAQDLELSGELKDWIRSFTSGDGPEARGAVSMFNLLSFKEGMKESYLEYGKAFASSIGKDHGGDAKIVGGVVHVNGTPREEGGNDGEGWDEVALAHYPSILHFAEMLADEGYQEINKRWRVPALRDTAILMTSEVEGWEGRARL
ncbi:hypothetical protein BU23DRAFT_165061 [Bimuria novae-zelandiae CBS 107.79]|uniref:EthD domain-containing protein n=1 Tax=Bimuria novae-zelandiae CBS 107.79 TaxID=1447943 RepID=A0A6A5V5D4_9PLEO|nr:hypothetical protein BU23DRAFT_165061 [Bimuria novae-zelandiae CBS 107.79]